MPWRQRRDDVVRDTDELVRTVEGLRGDQWTAATACNDWRAGDAATHVSASMTIQGHAFRHMLDGDETTPEWVEPAFESPERTISAVREGRASLVETMHELTDDHADRTVPLPVGTFPIETALDIILLEYGVHHWDITHAIDRRATLTDRTAAAVLRVAPAFVLFSGVPTDERIAYQLEGPSITLDLHSHDGAWALGPDSDGPTTVIRGSDAAIALFLLGRIGPDDGALSVDGPAARSFKAHFPGP